MAVDLPEMLTSLDWQCPYPSRRSPVFARNMVATSQPLAAMAGIQALRAGGNAVDAALASAITLTVVEPNNNGIGSDAFAIVHDGRSLHGLNASGRSPRAWSPERFKGMRQMPVLGWDAVTVPGAVSAWVGLSDRFGNLPFEKLFEAAIDYAEQGYQVGPETGYYWDLASLPYRAQPDDFKPFIDTFLPEGKVPPIGSVIRLPDHARSLQMIAESRGEAFYRGKLAEAMVRDSKARGGLLTLEDLEAHECTWVDPISREFAGTTLHEIPPNAQGLMALIATGIVDELDISAYPADSADSLHYQIEAMRIAWSDTERHLADPDYMGRDASSFLDTRYLQRRAGEIDPRIANPRPAPMGTSPDTVYLCTADAAGMMVSMIQSNYRGFGSGVVVPGTGISLQNRGAGFSLEPGHPNEVAGGKRPFHTIIPAFVTRNHDPLMAFGVMGGHMQAQGHLQMMVRVFVYNQNPQAASDAPRWHLREDGKVCLEDGFEAGVAEELTRRGHEIVKDNPEHLFGGAQLIYRMNDGYCGGSDHRKEGQALGF